jgi:hypothetical protein
MKMIWLFTAFLFSTACSNPLGSTSSTQANFLSSITPELASSWTPQWSSLIAYWKLNGTLGTVSNGANIPATLGGDGSAITSAGGLSYVQAHINQGLSLDGVTSYVSTPNINPTSAITVMAWVNLLSLPGGSNPNIVDKWDHPNTRRSWYLGTSSGHWGTAVSPDGLSGTWLMYNESATPVLGTWIHWAFTYDGQTMVTYKNGVVVSTLSFGTPKPIFSDSITNVWLGRSRNGAPLLNAIIDEVAIWSTNLSATDISTIYARQAAQYGSP